MAQDKEDHEDHPEHGRRRKFEFVRFTQAAVASPENLASDAPYYTICESKF